MCREACCWVRKTDFITLVYADNTIVDTVHNTTLNSLPIFLAASGGNPGCPAGSLDPTGLTAIFDATCITLPTGNTAITPGDLIMFQNANGATLQTVTAVNGQTLTFAGGGAGDAFALNGTAKPSGTIINIRNADGTFPPTTASRIWMITYYSEYDESATSFANAAGEFPSSHARCRSD